MENKCHQQHYPKNEMQIITMKNNSKPPVPKSEPQKDVRLSGKKYLSTMAIISSKLPYAFSGGQIMIASLHLVWCFSVFMKKIS